MRNRWRSSARTRRRARARPKRRPRPRAPAAVPRSRGAAPAARRGRRAPPARRRARRCRPSPAPRGRSARPARCRARARQMPPADARPSRPRRRSGKASCTAATRRHCATSRRCPGRWQRKRMPVSISAGWRIIATAAPECRPTPRHLAWRRSVFCRTVTPSTFGITRTLNELADTTQLMIDIAPHKSLFISECFSEMAGFQWIDKLLTGPWRGRPLPRCGRRRR